MLFWSVPFPLQTKKSSKQRLKMFKFINSERREQRGSDKMKDLSTYLYNSRLKRTRKKPVTVEKTNKTYFNFYYVWMYLKENMLKNDRVNF